MQISRIEPLFEEGDIVFDKKTDEYMLIIEVEPWAEIYTAFFLDRPNQYITYYFLTLHNHFTKWE